MMAAKNTIAICYRGCEHAVNTELEPELNFFKSLISFLLPSIEIVSILLSYSVSHFYHLPSYQCVF